MMSDSFMIIRSSPSSLISVPDHLPKSTRSPGLTSSGCSVPSSPRAPGPTATTSPSISFSLAVSGMMMPPAVFASCSMRQIRTRSCNGRNFIETLLVPASEARALAVSGRECQRANSTWAGESSCTTNKKLSVQTTIFTSIKVHVSSDLIFYLAVRAAERRPPAVDDAMTGPEPHLVSPGINAAIKPTQEHRSGHDYCPAPPLCSGCVMVSKDAVRRVGIERCQSGIEAEPRRAVGTEDRVRLAHIDVDVRVVQRRGHADALEFPHPDADFQDAAVDNETSVSDRAKLAGGNSGGDAVAGLTTWPIGHASISSERTRRAHQISARSRSSRFRQGRRSDCTAKSSSCITARWRPATSTE